MTGTLERLDELLSSAREADELLRATTELLASEPGIAWAGIAFLEGGELILGPSAGAPEPRVRRRATVTFQGERIGELWVDGACEEELLSRLAERLAELVLVGWDTHGEPWEP
ncbi:MAG: hypothetical protein RMM28_03880 [Thermoleophilia bacterium]|nr:hypothetical protein [Gaiellaceae bacterium]MDW8338259.1 hypothetical protein [Thermoleophilia bacterium]